jgi:hypothetical protein
LLFVISVCFGIAYLVLPQHQREYILQVRKLTALAELIFIAYAVTKLNKLRRTYKEQQALFADPVYNLRAAMAAVIGDSFGIKIIASEMAVLRYGLLFWKKETPAIKYGSTFSTHKEFGYIAIWCILLFAVMVEVTTLIIFFVADLSAIIKRKILINNEQLILRTGLRWQVITSISNINAIKKITSDYHSNNLYFKGGISKKSGNLLIIFKEPVMVDKLYGAGKPFSSILMNIDDFELFSALIDIKE